MEIELPKLAAEKREAMLPIFIKLRIERAEPHSISSRTESELPKRTKPKRLKEEPSLT
jgi:hypothetical protein